MKRLIFAIIAIALCFASSNSFAQKSKTFKKVADLYETQKTQFFVDVFALSKTGVAMTATAKADMDKLLFEAYLIDFAAWAKFTQKHEGEKPFKLKLKGSKEFDPEAKEYIAQFKLIQAELVEKRLIWTLAELKAFLTKEKLQMYIDPITTKFKDRTEALLSKINSSK